MRLGDERRQWPSITSDSSKEMGLLSESHAVMAGAAAPCEVARESSNAAAPCEAGQESATVVDTDTRENTDGSRVSWCVQFFRGSCYGDC
jgi:hypothetical protein